MCCCAIASCAVSKAWIQTFVDSQQQIWIGFSKSLTTNIQQSSNLGFGSGDRRKRSATCREESGDTTTHNNNKKQVRCPRGTRNKHREVVIHDLDLRETEKQSSLPQSDCLRSETWKTLLDHDALLCSIMQWSLDTTVDACLKGILFPRDKNLFVKVENFLNGMDHSRRIGIGDAEISPPFMSQKNRLIASNPRNKDFKCCRNCVCRWLRC